MIHLLYIHSWFSDEVSEASVKLDSGSDFLQGIMMTQLVDHWTHYQKVGVQRPSGVVGEFSSPELTFYADSYLVFILPPYYHSGT